MRVRFDEAVKHGWPHAARILRPRQAPMGYTSNTVLTEWLTLHCAGPWASRRSARWLTVLFSSGRDAARARAEFLPQGLWIDAPPENGRRCPRRSAPLSGR